MTTSIALSARSIHDAYTRYQTVMQGYRLWSLTRLELNQVIGDNGNKLTGDERKQLKNRLNLVQRRMMEADLDKEIAEAEIQRVRALLSFFELETTNRALMESIGTLDRMVEPDEIVVPKISIARK